MWNLAGEEFGQRNLMSTQVHVELELSSANTYVIKYDTRTQKVPFLKITALIMLFK